MKTLQEKYNAVLEGNFSKEQFRRDAVMQLPNVVSKFNSFEDMTTILKNRGMIAEAKMQEPKYSTARPEDTIAPDVIDTGIKFELDKKFGTLDVSDEDYQKAKETAIKNLSKDLLYYVKQDSIQLETPGEKMEKAKLNEGFFKKKPTAAPAKTAEILSTDEITNRIAEYEKTDSVEDIIIDALEEKIDLRNATPADIQKLEDVAKKQEDHITRDNYMAHVDYLKNGSKGEQPVSYVYEEISKEEEKEKEKAWKEYQEKRHVTDKTIAAAEKDFNKGWEEGKFRDGNYMAEETALDRAQDNAATKVQNALGDIADTVAEKPASVAAAFRKMVLANPVKYAKMSASELEKEFEAFKLEEGERPAYDDGVTQDSIDMSMTQAGMKEQQLKEAIKKIIAKVIAE